MGGALVEQYLGLFNCRNADIRSSTNIPVVAGHFCVGESRVDQRKDPVSPHSDTSSLRPMTSTGRTSGLHLARSPSEVTVGSTETNPRNAQEMFHTIRRCFRIWGLPRRISDLRPISLRCRSCQRKYFKRGAMTSFPVELIGKVSLSIAVVGRPGFRFPFTMTARSLMHPMRPYIGICITLDGDPEIGLGSFWGLPSACTNFRVGTSSFGNVCVACISSMLTRPPRRWKSGFEPTVD